MSDKPDLVAPQAHWVLRKARLAHVCQWPECMSAILPGTYYWAISMAPWEFAQVAEMGAPLTKSCIPCGEKFKEKLAELGERLFSESEIDL